MKVLVACEFSGVVRDAFIMKGHDAWSCDLLPTEVEGPHIQGDVLNILNDGWDIMIAHPPCTYLSNSGVRWLYEQPNRWDKMIEATKFFKELLFAPIERICIENPILHGYAIKEIEINYTQIIQPWQFGEDASKATCLWLKNLPLLEPTEIIIKDKYANQTPSGQNKLGPSKDRAKIRAKTYKGIAKAMADQWSN